MKILIKTIPQEIMDEYNVLTKFKDRYIYFRII